MIFPKYIHDCKKCSFHGHYKEFDLYSCGSSLIVRLSSEGSDYITSSLSFIKSLLKDDRVLNMEDNALVCLLEQQEYRAFALIYIKYKKEGEIKCLV